MLNPQVFKVFLFELPIIQPFFHLLHKIYDAFGLKLHQVSRLYILFSISLHDIHQKVPYLPTFSQQGYLVILDKTFTQSSYLIVQIVSVAYDWKVLVGKARSQLICLKIRGIFVYIRFYLFVIFAYKFHYLRFVLPLYEVQNRLLIFKSLHIELLLLSRTSLKANKNSLLLMAFVLQIIKVAFFLCYQLADSLFMDIGISQRFLQLGDCTEFCISYELQMAYLCCFLLDFSLVFYIRIFLIKSLNYSQLLSQPFFNRDLSYLRKLRNDLIKHINLWQTLFHQRLLEQHDCV